MTAKNYSMFYRRAIDVSRIAVELPCFDIFISAFNDSDRVKGVFGAIRARRKVWLLHPEYGYTPLEIPTDASVVVASDRNEMRQMSDLLAALGDIGEKSICIDITGFMRSVICFLVAKLAHSGVSEFTAVYSEPSGYRKQENTRFSTTTSGVVRPIEGMFGGGGVGGKDFLLIGIGYDHKLISEITHHKESATVYPIFAFPSLSPDFYQQSALRAADSGEVTLTNDWLVNRRFAPANDPFSTAQVLSEVVAEIDRASPGADVYLSPLATKVQALGFALYWQLEGRLRGGVTILLPDCVTYERETSEGLKRLWSFTVEL